MIFLSVSIFHNQSKINLYAIRNFSVLTRSFQQLIKNSHYLIEAILLKLNFLHKISNIYTISLKINSFINNCEGLPYRKLTNLRLPSLSKLTLKQY